MHNSSILRMKWFVETYVSRMSGDEIKVLDVGSYDVNGAYRQFFSGDRYRYTGMDMAKGPNVDLVLENPYDWSAIPDGSFDVVISGQALEHVEFFWITVAEMTRVLKKDGLLCLIVPNKCNEHRYPVDCYRFFTDGMLALARYVSLEPLHAHTNSAPSAKDTEWYSEKMVDAMLVARKPYDGPPKHPDLKTYHCVPADQESLRGGMVPYAKKRGLKRIWQKLRNKLARDSH